jgi:hypothetical protein
MQSNTKPPEDATVLDADSLANQWEKINQLSREVSLAYYKLVETSDALADALGYNREWLLGHIFPKCRDDRRKHKRILDWIKYEKEKFNEHISEKIIQDRIRSERTAILKRLNLTGDEKAILGICDEIS